jgi:thioredoxin-like negative regulator of GroEL
MTAARMFKRCCPLAAAVLLLLAVLFLSVPAPRHADAGEGLPELATMQDVERAINTLSPVLIQFDAKWCGYCRALQPHLQKLRDKNLKSDLHMYKIDVDDAKDVAAEFGVRSLPTMFIVHKGKVVGYKRGGISEGELFDWVAGVQAEIRKG